MTENNSTLTQERLKEILNYNSDTGEFTWLIYANRNGAHIGDKAGCISHYGYIIIGIKNRDYRAHRLAWLYIYGEWPKDQIDHINGVRFDNRINNLRSVTNAINGKNQRIRDCNTSGVCGVYWDKSRKKWAAEIIVNHKKIYLGRYHNIKDAAIARKNGEAKYGFHQNHGT